MTYAVQSKLLEDIAWSDIEALVTEGAEETATLEFKSAGIWGDAVVGKDGDKPLLTEHDMAKNDVVEAICGFANAYGGVLVVGVLTSGAPDRATKIDPITDVEKKAQKLREIGATSFDPPLHGLRMRVVTDSLDTTRGAIVFRAPASLAAPHAAKYAVIAGKRSAQRPLTTDVAMWRPFVRRNADTKEMSMRDLHSMFWESRTRQERLRAVRAKSTERLERIRKCRDSGRLVGRNWPSQMKPIVRRGAFVRCVVVFHHPLSIPISNLKDMYLLKPRACGVEIDSIFYDTPRYEPHFRGFSQPFDYGGSLQINSEGTLDACAFVPGYPIADRLGEEITRNGIDPRHFLAIFSAMTVFGFKLLHRSNTFGNQFEIDIAIEFDPAARGVVNDSWAPYDAAEPTAEIGPMIIADSPDIRLAIESAHISILRSCGFECERPIESIQKFEFIERLRL